MSPMAVGNPHTRTFSVDSSRTVDTPSNPTLSGLEDLKSQRRVFPHLDDLVIARPDVDSKSPLRTILQKGDTLARQADTHLDFRRPDLALQEYVSASEIAVEIVPRHPDYLALQKDRGELYRLYMGLNKRINSQHSKFAEVKDLIKADNARTGVKPLSKTVNGDEDVSAYEHATRSTIKQNSLGKTNGYSDTIPSNKRPAPAIQPKPDALHGKAIPPTNGISDLATRFARLQNGGPVQDPRINTRPIQMPSPPVSTSKVPASPYGNGHTVTRPAGPREIPPSTSARPRPANSSSSLVISGMPRAPDAIHHSPLRTVGSHDVDAANLPSSVSRNASFLSTGRKNSAPPISTVGPSPYAVDERRVEYFTSPTHSSHDHNVPLSTDKRNFPPPDSTTITSETLVGYLKRGQQALKVLIVDLRNRQEFDSGHIMSQSTICVEPITLRHGISGEELSDSMVIAPTSEQHLFERRQEFDLLVFYDQSSTSIQSSTLGKTNDSVLRDFASAVYDFGYEKRLKRRPLLLSGGLDAWVDLLGPYSLQSSTSTGGPITAASSSIRSKTLKSLSVSRREVLLATKLRTQNSRLGSQKEEQVWDSVMKSDIASANFVDFADTSIAEELPYATTQDEFLRRYPELPVQESMTSARPRQHVFEDPLPQPPTRPAPALPRQRSSGITEKGLSLRYAQPAGPSTTTLVYKRGLVGLQNNGNTCYLNAAIQLISNSTALRNLFINFNGISVPKKQKETSPPMQLMTRAVGNLLTHIWSGQYSALTPSTLLGYINAVACTTSDNIDVGGAYRAQAYGGTIQHDSGEFIMWLIEVIMDELNPNRDAPPRIVPGTETVDLGKLQPGTAAKRQFDVLMRENNSIIMKEMGLLDHKMRICGNTTCKSVTRAFRLSLGVRLLVNDSKKATTTLENLFNQSYGPGSVIDMDDVLCEVCNTKTTHKSEDWLGRLPRTLWVALDRGDKEMAKAAIKVQTVVKFENRINLTKYFKGDGLNSDGLEPEFKGQFMYEIVSVVHHSGKNVHQGHYFNYSKVRNPGNGDDTWHLFNDRSVTPCSFEATKTGTATFICLERIGN